MTKFAEKRKSLGHSQHSIAPLLGVSYKTVQSWEQGYRNVPKTVWILLKHLKKRSKSA